jgi:transposase
MANLLKMANVQSILLLHAQGWTQRRIARELEIDRGTVRKYVRQQLCGAKPANAPTGSEDSKPANLPMVPAPGPKPANLPIGGRAGPAGPKPAHAPTGSAFPTGLRSKCEPHREVVLAKMQEGLSAQRIYQDLGGAEAGLGYDSVRRFMRRLGGHRTLPFRRTECQAGEEAQVDFGAGARIQTPEGRWRKTNVFRIVLSHSRKAYSEASYTQTTEDFLRCLENALAHFGGVPAALVIDNLKAAVAHPDWFDPEITPKVQSFCQHYGTVILPTKPYMPRHKGKVESGIKYVKNNALKGRTFTSLAEQNEHLAQWERTVADTRIHGTTKQQVGKVFVEAERAALRPLPLERFPCFQEAQRKVNRDGHIEVAKAYYSAPPEYLGRTVWVRWDTRLVRILQFAMGADRAARAA